MRYTGNLGKLIGNHICVNAKPKDALAYEYKCQKCLWIQMSKSAKHVFQQISKSILAIFTSFRFPGNLNCVVLCVTQ